MKNTDTKEKILELLFDFPTRRFHVREIARMLNISPPAVSKALNQLEKEEMIILTKKFLYEIKANLENSNFKNLKRVSNLKKIYSSGLLEYLHDKFPMDTIILFGSYSRGEDIERSDIDIAIIGKEKPLGLERYNKKFNKDINIEFLDFKKIDKNLRDNVISGITLSGYINL